MPKNTRIWLILEIAFYLLIFYLVVDFVSLTIDRCKENYGSTIDEITLIAEVDPIIIHQLNQAENQRRTQQLREQQRQLRERQQQWNEVQQQEWSDRQQQWRNNQREQQREYRDRREQQRVQQREQFELRRQQQERIHQREELMILQKKSHRK